MCVCVSATENVALHYPSVNMDTIVCVNSYSVVYVKSVLMIAVEVFRSSHCKFSLRTAAVIFQKSKFIINPESKQQFSIDVLTC